MLDSEYWFVFRLTAGFFMTVPAKNVVSPSARTLRTTPTMI